MIFKYFTYNANALNKWQDSKTYISVCTNNLKSRFNLKLSIFNSLNEQFIIKCPLENFAVTDHTENANCKIYRLFYLTLNRKIQVGKIVQLLNAKDLTSLNTFTFPTLKESTIKTRPVYNSYSISSMINDIYYDDFNRGV